MASRFVFVLCVFVMSIKGMVSGDSTAHVSKKQKQILLATGAGGLTLGSLVYLNQAWYAAYNTGHFHFFNDNNEWLQMDKAGHLWTNYQLSRLMIGAFDWAEYKKKSSIWVGGLMGFGYMTAVEVMDGYSKGWGFSWGDELANISGTALSISQEVLLKEQKILLKFSYANSGLARYNPSLLGKNAGTQILKDYNGQTYWLSVNPLDLAKRKNKWPVWLNLAFGYKADGMLGANNNKILIYGEGGQAITFARLRHYLFSVDVNLGKIKTKNKVLKHVFSVFNMLKIPAPALAFSKQGLKFHYLYY